MDKKSKILITSSLIILLLVAICFLYSAINLEKNKNTENKAQNNIQEKIISDDNNEETDNTSNVDLINKQKNIGQSIQNGSKYYYFAYGSNMNIDTIRSRTKNPDINPVSSVYINNYKLTFPSGVGNIEKSNGTMLWGCLFLLSIDEIHDIDLIEGYKEGRQTNMYDRKIITVTAPQGNTYEAYVYIQPQTGGDTTSESYKNTIIKGANDCNLPADYIDKLENIKTN